VEEAKTRNLPNPRTREKSAKAIAYSHVRKMLTEANSTKNCLAMDVTKCPNELVRYAYNYHWDDDASAYCEAIVS